MSSGRGWTTISLLSGAIAILVFVAVFMAYGGRVATTGPVSVAPTPGQPVDTPFIFAPPPPLQAQPSAAPETAAPASQPGSVGSSASDNNAAPDISAAPNPFTAGIHEPAH